MNKMKAARFIKQVNQPMLALVTGISQTRISLIENSLVTPRLDEMLRIADALWVKVEDIFPEESSNGSDER